MEEISEPHTLVLYTAPSGAALASGRMGLSIVTDGAILGGRMAEHRDPTAYESDIYSRKKLTLGGVGAIVVARGGEGYATCVAAGVGFSVGVGVLTGVLGLICEGVQLVVARSGSHGKEKSASRLAQRKVGGREGAKE